LKMVKQKSNRRKRGMNMALTLVRMFESALSLVTTLPAASQVGLIKRLDGVRKITTESSSALTVKNHRCG
jgi:hypothetical protein